MSRFIRMLTVLLAIILLTMFASACATRKTTKPDDGNTWISPGKIEVDNLAAGQSVKHTIALHNGNLTQTEFAVYYREPDYTGEGFVSPPENAQEWIGINNQALILNSNETKEIEITLSIPEKSQTADRWEFWIGVKQNSQKTVVTELCSRWLITMKGN